MDRSAINKLGEQPYYFSGSFATQSEWLADVTFNGNYARFCEVIGREYSRAETLISHYTEPADVKGRGNGFFYPGYYYVGARYHVDDSHVYGNGNPDDIYNVWKYSGSAGWAIVMNGWTFERTAIIWCK